MNIDYQRKAEAMEKRNSILEIENEKLRVEVFSLRNALISDNIPLSLRLTNKEAMIFGVLMSRPIARKSDLMKIYETTYSSDQIPEEKIIDVFVCKIRKKIELFDIKIESVWGQGYSLSVFDKDKVRDLYQKEGHA